MKHYLDRLERSGMNIALVMFLFLCGISALHGALTSLVATRNVMFLLMGVAGLLVSGELSGIRRMRISMNRKRTLMIAEYLLIALSIVLLVYSMMELGVIGDWSRWD